MEFAGIAMLILVLAVVFRTPLRKGNAYMTQVIDTEINEEQVDLIERSMTAYSEVIERCGEDFKTPSEVFDLMTKRKKLKSKQ